MRERKALFSGGLSSKTSICLTFAIKAVSRATLFHIKICAPGSIVIETEIHPDASGRGPLSRNVFANLDKQVMDPESQLRVGLVTRATKAQGQVGRSGQP
jgi:hypothetical protein